MGVIYFIPLSFVSIKPAQARLILVRNNDGYNPVYLVLFDQKLDLLSHSKLRNYPGKGS